MIYTVYGSTTFGFSLWSWVQSSFTPTYSSVSVRDWTRFDQYTQMAGINKGRATSVSHRPHVIWFSTQSSTLFSHFHSQQAEWQPCQARSSQSATIVWPDPSSLLVDGSTRSSTHWPEGCLWSPNDHKQHTQPFHRQQPTLRAIWQAGDQLMDLKHHPCPSTPTTTPIGRSAHSQAWQSTLTNTTILMMKCTLGSARHYRWMTRGRQRSWRWLRRLFALRRAKRAPVMRAIEYLLVMEFWAKRGSRSPVWAGMKSSNIISSRSLIKRILESTASVERLSWLKKQLCSKYQRLLRWNQAADTALPASSSCDSTNRCRPCPKSSRRHMYQRARTITIPLRMSDSVGQPWITPTM